MDDKTDTEKQLIHTDQRGYSIDDEVEQYYMDQLH